MSMSGCAGVPNKVAGEATFLPSPHDGATVLHCVSARGRRTVTPDGSGESAEYSVSL